MSDSLSAIRAELLKLVNKDVQGRLPNFASRLPGSGFVTTFCAETRVIRVDHVDCPEFWVEIPLDSVVGAGAETKP